MAATPSLKVTKQFTYRGVTRTFSNRYHFVGGTPADGAHWTTFSDAVVNAEKLIFTSAVTIIGTTGYAAGSEVPVFSKTYSTAGTRTLVGVRAPGDCAALFRYATTARSSKNHPVYLFNYYHDTEFANSTVPDTITAAVQTIYGTYATAWDSSGFSDGTNTYKRAGPNGASAVGHVVEPLITHRDLPR
jgi:hypothetical protein